MQSSEEIFVDFLEERRRSWNILWIFRPIDSLLSRKSAPELVDTTERMIEVTLDDPRLKSAICTAAAQRNVSVSTIIAEARSILQEMASRIHLPTGKLLALLVTWVLKRIYMSICINRNLLYRIKDQMSHYGAQYVYVPTHRSYLDFLLVSYLIFAHDMDVPNVASGINLYHMKFIGEWLRKSGSFYIRRSFSDDHLYKNIFKSYVSSLMTHSDRALEFFIEGTRSRSQKSLSPKFGFLSTVLENLFKCNVPDIQFIPISISYDKPLEELLFVYELLGVPKPAETALGLIRSFSVLREPSAYGHVYVKIAPPISVLDYLDSWQRQSPDEKVPPHIMKRLAYAIVDCQKKNTILTPFNLVSILYNEHVHSQAEKAYNIHELLQDYKWLKNVLVTRFEVSVNPPASNALFKESVGDEDEQEVLEALQTHKNLMELDLDQNLMLKPRHSDNAGIKNVKGYALSEVTLRMSVPVINLMIYVNPVFAYLSKQCIATLCTDALSKDVAVKRYLMLRRLFSVEFALPVDLTEMELTKEYKEVTQFSCGERFHSVLYNLLLPFVECLHVLCSALLQWENSVSCVDKNIMKECQRRVESSFYEKTAVFKHPYCLSLDIYVALLSSLVATESVTLSESKAYEPKIEKLEEIVSELDEILKRRPRGSYLHLFSSVMPDEMPIFRTKLKLS